MRNGPLQIESTFNFVKKQGKFTHGGLLGGRGPSKTGFFNSNDALQLMNRVKVTGNSLTDRNKHSALISMASY